MGRSEQHVDTEGSVCRGRSSMGVLPTDWILRDDGCDEVGGDQLGALVHQLVEGVLTVGACAHRQRQRQPWARVHKAAQHLSSQAPPPSSERRP
eukprot:894036-Prymnesium_polylepis.2